MKRIKILLLVFMLMFPAIVKADMGAPGVNYNVRIINPKGAFLYDYDAKKGGYAKTGDKVEYDKVVKITFEVYEGDIVYGGFVCVDEAEKNCAFINLADTVSADYNLDEYYQKDAKSFYVFDDSCYLYTGPSSNVYKRVEPETKLSVGYSFSTNYYDETWAYVPEKKGWIYTYTYQSYTGKNAPAGVVDTTNSYNNNILTMQDTVLYNNPKTKEKVLATIPANTKLTAKYYYSLNPHQPFYYVSYKGYNGFIETISDYESNAIINIAFERKNTSLIVKNKEGAKLYSKPSLNSDVIATIPFGTDLNSDYVIDNYYNVWLYRVSYNNQVGWVENSDENFDDSIVEEVPEEISDESITESEESRERITPNENNRNEKKSLKKTIITSIIVVILISLTALGSILLINKKRGQKDVVVPPENNK